MNLTLFNRDVLAQTPALLNELDQLVSRINTVWRKQHDPQTGAHTDLTLDSLDFNSGSSQLTVGAAGAASALPATPSLYQSVFINGIEYVMPLYEKS